MSHHPISSLSEDFTAALVKQDRFGMSCGSLSDLNGDGISELMVGAPGPVDDNGRAFILFLRTDGSVISHQQIGADTGGFTFEIVPDDSFANVINSAGDVNGDSIHEAAISAPYGLDSFGIVYILFLTSAGTVDSTQRIGVGIGNFTAALAQDGLFGYSVVGLGDLNGDHFSDILVGAPGNNDPAFVLYLHATGTVLSHQIISGADGWTNDYLVGTSVGSAGDQNQDGFIDVLLGLSHPPPNLNSPGPRDVGLWYSQPRPRHHLNVPLEFLDQGSVTEFGNCAAGIGDIDMDGIPDVLIGGKYYHEQILYVLFLNNNGTVRSHQQIKADDIFDMFDSNSQYEFGLDCGSAQDFNNDGVNDVLVTFSQTGASLDSGIVLILLESNGTVLNRYIISASQAGINLERPEWSGMCVDGGSDLDGNGVGDFVIGAPLEPDFFQTGSQLTEEGLLIVFLMHESGTVMETVEVAPFPGWFTAPLTATSHFGSNVGFIGDINGDLVDDILASSVDFADTWAGQIFIFFHYEGSWNSPVHQLIGLGQGGFTANLAAGELFGASHGRLSDMNGDQIPDVLVGAPGHDLGGAVYLLYLQATAIVLSHTKLTTARGGFTGFLASDDIFGTSCTRDL